MPVSVPFPYVEVVLTIGTWSLVEAALVDTGFDGGLLIPAYLRHEVLAEPGWVPLRMPDGSMVRAASWSGTVDVDGRTYNADVAALGSRFLLGRQVTDNFTVCFELGRRVTVAFNH